MSISYKDQKDKFEKRLRELYKKGMPRAIESQKVVEAKKSLFFDSTDIYMTNKIEIFVKNVEYLKVKHDMSDYKLGNFICMQSGFSNYKTTAIGFLVNKSRMSIEKLLFHAKVVGFSFDIDPLDLITVDIEFNESNGIVKKFWK
jgi:hypothetical protein